MGRSVNYLNHAEYVIYFSADWINEDESSCEWYWEDFKDHLISSICSKLKSYEKVEKWEDETSIFLENELCEIGISEYCYLYSLSIRAKDDEFYYNAENIKEGLAKHHAEQIRNTLEKCLKDRGGTLFNRLCTMSNGVGVFELAK